jgi:hypothetical protein
MKELCKLLLLVFVTSVITISCNNGNNIVPDLTEDITGTYIGSLNVTSPSYQNTSYVVTVSKVTNTRVRITPQDSNASTWEQDIMKPTASTVTCVICTTSQFSVTLSQNPVTLAYNYNSAEQFSGTKQ